MPSVEAERDGREPESTFGEHVTALLAQLGPLPPKTEERRREDDLIAERMQPHHEADPMPRPRVTPPPAGGDEEEFDDFVHSPEGRKWQRQRDAWFDRAYNRAATARRQVREELRAARRRPQARLPRPLPTRSLLRVARPRERRQVRRVAATARSPGRLDDDPDLADPPDVARTLLALVRRWRR